MEQLDREQIDGRKIVRAQVALAKRDGKAARAAIRETHAKEKKRKADADELTGQPKRKRKKAVPLPTRPVIDLVDDIVESS
jgi:hypothetical protein